MTMYCICAGLDPDTDHILELAVLITDGDLSAPHLEVHVAEIFYFDFFNKPYMAFLEES